MGNVCKIIVVTFLCVVSIVNVKCQIVQTYCMQDYSSSELDSLVIGFWRNSHEEYLEFPVRSISDLGFYDLINSTWTKLHKNSCEMILRITHTNLDIEQVILFYYGYMHLIDMRNPLPEIIKNLKEFEEFSNSFLEMIISQVRIIHKYNWYLRFEGQDYELDAVRWGCEDSSIVNKFKYNENEW